MNETSRGDRWVRRRFVLAAMMTGIILLAACGSGLSARIHLFSADGAGVIGRADLDGTAVDQRFIRVQTGRPLGVTLVPGS
jgi:hypothetical protein